MRAPLPAPPLKRHNMLHTQCLGGGGGNTREPFSSSLTITPIPQTLTCGSLMHNQYTEEVKSSSLSNEGQQTFSLNVGQRQRAWYQLSGQEHHAHQSTVYKKKQQLFLNCVYLIVDDSLNVEVVRIYINSHINSTFYFTEMTQWSITGWWGRRSRV